MFRRCKEPDSRAYAMNRGVELHPPAMHPFCTCSKTSRLRLLEKQTSQLHRPRMEPSCRFLCFEDIYTTVLFKIHKQALCQHGTERLNMEAGLPDPIPLPPLYPYVSWLQNFDLFTDLYSMLVIVCIGAPKFLPMHRLSSFLLIYELNQSNIFFNFIQFSSMSWKVAGCMWVPTKATHPHNV